MHINTGTFGLSAAKIVRRCFALPFLHGRGVRKELSLMEVFQTADWFLYHERVLEPVLGQWQQLVACT